MPTLVSLYQFAKDVSKMRGVYAEVFVEWVDNKFQGYKKKLSPEQQLFTTESYSVLYIKENVSRSISWDSSNSEISYTHESDFLHFAGVGIVAL